MVVYCVWTNFGFAFMFVLTRWETGISCSFNFVHEAVKNQSETGVNLRSSSSVHWLQPKSSLHLTLSPVLDSRYLKASQLNEFSWGANYMSAAHAGCCLYSCYIWMTAHNKSPTSENFQRDSLLRAHQYLFIFFYKRWPCSTSTRDQQHATIKSLGCT